MHLDKAENFMEMCHPKSTQDILSAFGDFFIQKIEKTRQSHPRVNSTKSEASIRSSISIIKYPRDLQPCNNSRKDYWGIKINILPIRRTPYNFAQKKPGRPFPHNYSNDKCFIVISSRPFPRNYPMLEFPRMCLLSSASI